MTEIAVGTLDKLPPTAADRPNPPSPALPLVVIGLISAAACVLGGTSTRVAWIGPIVGAAYLIGVPTYILLTTVDWKSDRLAERICLSVVLTLTGLMVVGLLIDVGLPPLGIARPLDGPGVVISSLVAIVALGGWRRRRWSPLLARHPFPALTGRDATVLLALPLIVGLAAIGAVRINNGAGNGVTMVMLVLAAAVLGLTGLWRHRLHPGTITVVCYGVPLALLLMTSLRGWYTTGHDIQIEYRFFELTKSAGHWTPTLRHNPYNACLSLTILPTMLWHLTLVADPYVFKFFFPLLFALVGPMAYLVLRRYAGPGVALVGIAYFIAFPTFFTDMPFLNRQEIGFLFVGAALLVVTNQAAGVRWRRWWLVFFSCGMVLVHYSTTYIFAAVLLGAWILRVVLSFAERRWGHPRPRARWRDGWSAAPVVTIVGIVILAGFSALWSGPITSSTGNVSHTLDSLGQALQGKGGAKQSATAYSLFSGSHTSAQQQFEKFIQSTIPKNEPGRTNATKLLTRYPAQYVPSPNLPVTSVGRVINDSGLRVSTINTAIRQGSARLLQIFVLIGLGAVLLVRRRRFLEMSSEFYLLATASLVVVAAQVVLPVLSVDYGVLRAFQQSLLVLAPFMVAGSLALFGILGSRVGRGLTVLVAGVFFLSLTGVIPQSTGGYPAQLHLNNSGIYYDQYYTHPEEISAVQWVDGVAAAGAPLDMVPTTYNRMASYTRLRLAGNIFPDTTQPNGWIFFDYTQLTTGLGSASYAGNTLFYRYPTAFVQDTKNLVFSSPGAQIYR